ncbi:MAG: hypothetical protein HRU24_07635 [Gammaproteobacteria bacterium]|nr:hypothetical protein [Gammaproteobacteria bacterium]
MLIVFGKRSQQPHFDYSNVSVVNELLPSVNYEYQCGYIHILDDEEPDLSNLFWILVKIHQFRTKYKDDAITFAFGSIFDSQATMFVPVWPQKDSIRY